MEVSCRLGVRLEGRQLGLRREASWLSIDYARCASRVWVGPFVARPQEGFRGGGWRRSLSAGLSEPWLRAIVIFALIHQPILPLSFVALGAH